MYCKIRRKKNPYIENMRNNQSACAFDSGRAEQSELNDPLGMGLWRLGKVDQLKTFPFTSRALSCQLLQLCVKQERLATAWSKNEKLPLSLMGLW